MRSCVRPCGHTAAGSLQKQFLPFRLLLNVGIDPDFPQKRFFFALLRKTEISFSLTTLSAITDLGQTKVYELMDLTD